MTNKYTKEEIEIQRL